MSHLKERKEKNCLNCNAQVYGKYCHICGQENIEPRETFWSLATHFVYDIVHFDGKFFSTLKYLLFKPGFLSYEYLRGRRASYLHPIRMYVFTSAIFFIIFFTFISKPADISLDKISNAAELIMQIDSLKTDLSNANDSLKKVELKKQIDSLQLVISKINNDTSRSAATKKGGFNFSFVKPEENNRVNVNFSNDDETPEHYDSVQASLSEDKRDNWFIHMLNKKRLTINEEYKNNPHELTEKLQEKFLHSIPQIMFISLPVVALIMQLLYVRRRKEFFYVNHVVFLLHVYIATFILILLSNLFSYFWYLTGLSLFIWLMNLSILAIFFYIYKAFRNFYEQGRIKTIIKFLLLFFAFSIIVVLLVSVFLFTSVMQL